MRCPTARDDVLEALERVREPRTGREIASEVGRPTRTVVSTLLKLAKEGLAKRAGTKLQRGGLANLWVKGAT